MASPFLAFANAYLLVEEPGVPSIVNGRVTSTPPTTYLLEVYLRRDPSINTLESIGTSGLTSIYKGYGLRATTVASGFDITTAPGTGPIWSNLGATPPTYLSHGMVVDLWFKDTPRPLRAVIRELAGRYGGAGIDTLVAQYTEGLPITLSIGDVTE